MSAPQSPARRPLRVAVIGPGVVGGETARRLLSNPLAPADGRQVELAAVVARRPDAATAAGLPRDLVSTDPAPLLADPAIDAVVETVGGDEPARTYIATALERGKAVVTANKHVIAHHGPALEALARAHGAALRFEAAVAGGIPVLGPLARDLGANRVAHVRGIVNGTTNFILTAMARDGAGYAETLAAAQAAGYAEADPTGDVSGADAVNKLTILVRLAFGVWLDPADIPSAPPALDPNAPRLPGITGVDAETIAGARALGYAVKLVADARRLADGSVEAAVLPTALPLEDPLARTSGVTNRVEIAAEPVGFLGFSGPGAGGPATSSAVLGDLLAIARGAGSTWAGLPPVTSATPGALRSPILDSSVHRWLVVAPVAASALPHDADVRAVEIHGGTALHFGPRSLAAVRAYLAQADAPGTTRILIADHEG